jgi:hypothetical protein
MRTLFASRRRRYALGLLLVGAGSLAVMGNSCAPTKPPPPATGLAIAPPAHDFGTAVITVSTGTQTFTVTNHGPHRSGTLTVAMTSDFNGDNFVTSDDQCTGHKLDPGDSCTVKAAFRPLPFEGAKTGILQAKSDVADDGQGDAVLTGVAVES